MFSMEFLSWNKSSFDMEILSIFLFFWSTRGILFFWLNIVHVGQGLWLFLPFSIVLFLGVDWMRNPDLMANSKFTAKTRNKI